MPNLAICCLSVCHMKPSVGLLESVHCSKPSWLCQWVHLGQCKNVTYWECGTGGLMSDGSWVNNNTAYCTAEPLHMHTMEHQPVSTKHNEQNQDAELNSLIRFGTRQQSIHLRSCSHASNCPWMVQTTLIGDNLACAELVVLRLKDIDLRCATAYMIGWTGWSTPGHVCTGWGWSWSYHCMNYNYKSWSLVNFWLPISSMEPHLQGHTCWGCTQHCVANKIHSIKVLKAW